ncbi:helix-turn-helix domain-containing protein [Actinacidiphila oryziradicis]|uniref:helix-turn-helix domain-containing protein n=1 Tax=Actinacidiphila oryziradicis TaxID=2571141 RepID=UPI001FEB222C|nr:helix-turn-helix domain-containing protein [Actinacidiphila oryziradicis]
MYLTTGQAATLIGVSIPTVERFLASGLIIGAGTSGRQVFPLETAQAMASRPLAPLAALPGPEIPVLRVDVAEQVDDDDRQWIGFGTALNHTQLLLALRGSWRCDPNRVAASKILPITLGGFVVAVLTTLGNPVSDNGGRYARHSFPHARLPGYITELCHPVNATVPDPSDTEGLTYTPMLLGTRLPSVSGGPIAYVPTGTAARGNAPGQKEL